MGSERTADWYTRFYRQGMYRTDQYNPVYLEAAKHCHGRVLDMGCGIAPFRPFVPKECQYDGFDFSEVAVEAGLRQGDLYTEPLEGYDTYVLLEVIEHIDDLRVLERIPPGKRVVLSVPSYDSPGHVRTYTEASARERFAELLDIQHVQALDWHWREKEFVPVAVSQGRHILVISAVRKQPETALIDLVGSVQLPTTNIYHELLSADGYALLGCARARVGLDPAECEAKVRELDCGLGEPLRIRNIPTSADNRYVYTMWACSELYEQTGDGAMLGELADRTTDIGAYAGGMYRYCADEVFYLVPNATSAAAAIFGKAGRWERAAEALVALQRHLKGHGILYADMDKQLQPTKWPRREDDFHLAMMAYQVRETVARLTAAGELPNNDVLTMEADLACQIVPMRSGSAAGWNAGPVLPWGYPMLYALLRNSGHALEPELRKSVLGINGLMHPNFRVRAMAAWAVTR